MKALHIDFAAPSWGRTVARTHLWAWVLVLVGLGLSLAVVAQTAALAYQKEKTEAAMQDVQTQLDARAQQKPVAVKTDIAEVQAKGINAVVQQLNLPWRDLLNALEESTPPNVALLALEPDAKRQTLKATAETKTDAEMIAYIERLKKQNVFDSVSLVKHEVNAQDPNRPLRFQFEAQWREAPL